MQFLSGVVNGHTTGTAIALMIREPEHPQRRLRQDGDLLRPGHADYTAYAKYHGFQDARGGGHFSGRSHCRAGGRRCHRAGRAEAPASTSPPISPAARAFPIRLLRWTMPPHWRSGERAGPARPRALPCWMPVEEPMKTAIRAAGAEGDSVGGITGDRGVGLPAGVGEP